MAKKSGALHFESLGDAGMAAASGRESVIRAVESVNESFDALWNAIGQKASDHNVSVGDFFDVNLGSGEFINQTVKSTDHPFV